MRAPGSSRASCTIWPRTLLGIAHHAAVVGADVPIADAIVHDDENVGFEQGDGLSQRG
jgi:hypothetical protein